MPAMSVDAMRIAPHDDVAFMTWFIWFDWTASCAFEQTGEQLALGLDEIEDAQRVVVDVLEMRDRFLADALDFLAQQLREHFAERADRAAERQRSTGAT